MGGKPLYDQVIGSINLIDPLCRYSNHTMKRPYYEVLLLPRCECFFLSCVHDFDEITSKVHGLDPFRHGLRLLNELVPNYLDISMRLCSFLVR